MMYILMVGLAAALMIVLWRYAALTQEIKRLTRMLNNIDFEQSNRQLTISYDQKKVRALVEAVNRCFNNFRVHTRAVEESEKEMRRSVSHLSHDLRTPLTSLLGYIGLVKRSGILDTQKLGYLEIAESKARVLTTLVEELFTGFTYTPERVDISALIADTLTDYVDEIERTLGAPTIDLTENAVVIGDRTMLIRVFRNVIQNALRYGCGQLSVTTGITGHNVALTVQNSVVNENAQPSQGEGLGMNIVQKLIETMGGTVTAAQQNGMFTVVITLGLV